MSDIKSQILNAHKTRQAIKTFTDKKITEEDFDFILETGRLSPSSFGWEPWQFLVVQNMELREKLKAFSWGAQTQLPTASHFVIILAKKAKHMVVGSDYFNHMSTNVKKVPQESLAMRDEFFDNFQKNMFDLTDDRKIFDWTCKQTYIALANMMTVAAEIGIDSCPIEGFSQAAIDKILADEGIIDPDEYSASVMVAFGYKASDLDWPKSRKPVPEAIKWIK